MDVLETIRSSLLVGVGDQIVDFALVMIQKGIDVFTVDECGALGARKYEVKVDEKPKPSVEGNPAKNEIEGVFHNVQEGEGDKIHEPWCKDGRVGGMQGFVGQEDGKEDSSGHSKKTSVWRRFEFWSTVTETRIQKRSSKQPAS